MTTSALFQLPLHGQVYSDSLFDRCRGLVSYGVWAGIAPARLDAWIANFKTPEERYFAAKVLDSLIYRSDIQTIALMRHLFSRVIPDYFRLARPFLNVNNIYHSLRGNTDPGVRIVPVVPPNSSPGKSALTLARYLKRALKFNEAWIIYPHDIPSHIGPAHTFICFDDFLGTGFQFTDFANDSLSPYWSAANFAYASLAGHIDGIGTLQPAFPELHIMTVERLGNSHALFHKDAAFFPDDVNDSVAAREFYYWLLEDRGIDLTGPNRRGFGHFELTYAFEHSVPDNSLPILWWDDSPKWTRLFDR